MKKKILAVALAVALIAIVVGSSLAYFTDEDKVTNTFTFGSVLIDIFENGVITDEDVIKFEELMLPVVDMNDLTNDPGYFAKEIKVQSNGENAAYIRTLLAIPTALKDYLILDVKPSSGWTLQDEYLKVDYEGVNYTVYLYDYEQPVDPKAANEADRFTNAVLKGVYLASDVDIKDNPDTPSADLEFCKPDGNGGYTFSGFVAHSKVTDGYQTNTLCVLVAAQAIQAQGFDDGASDALNTGFPIGTNPWGTATILAP